MNIYIYKYIYIHIHNHQSTSIVTLITFHESASSFFCTLVSGHSRLKSLKLRDTRFYKPHIRAPPASVSTRGSLLRHCPKMEKNA